MWASWITYKPTQQQQQQKERKQIKVVVIRKCLFVFMRAYFSFIDKEKAVVGDDEKICMYFLFSRVNVNGCEEA
jgi:hypothetical protein